MKTLSAALAALLLTSCGLVGVDASESEGEGAQAQAGVAGAPRADDAPREPPAAAAFGVTGMTPEQVTDGVRAALDSLREGRDGVDAAVHGAAALERLACHRLLTESTRSCALIAPQVDAAVMDSGGKFGSVLLLEKTANPVSVAQAVAATPFITLVGESATSFAGLAAATAPAAPAAPPGEAPAPAAHTPAPAVMGALGSFGVLVRTTGGNFAAAMSTEWVQRVPRGRTSAVPYPGAALFAGPHAAVAVTGDVNLIIRNRIARAVHDDIASGTPLRDAVEARVEKAGDTALSVVALGHGASHASSNRRVPWAQLVLKSESDMRN